MNSTAVIVKVESVDFDPVDRNIVTMLISWKVNGDYNSGGSDYVSYTRPATQAVKQAAIRNKINAQLGSIEPAFVALTNAAIEISGLPV